MPIAANHKPRVFGYRTVGRNPVDREQLAARSMCHSQGQFTRPRSEKQCVLGWSIVREIRTRRFSRFGSDLLSHTLRCSTIGAKALNGRVRDGTGCFALAMTTKPKKSSVQVNHTGCGMLSTNWQSLPFTGSNQAYRAISTGQLNVLPRLHLRPIDEMVYLGPQGYLVLRGASRLDAFSGYPVRS